MSQPDIECAGCAAADGNPFHCPMHRPIDSALYAVLKDGEYRLAIWLDGSDVFRVVNNQMQSGDRWKPEWISRFVYVTGGV